MWEQTAFGARLHKSLPITIDSLRAKTLVDLDELEPRYHYIAKPKSRWPLWQRIQHAWLVLTAQAFAVQFSEDHLRLAKKKGAKPSP
jgi:hypothetical protein